MPALVHVTHTHILIDRRDKLAKKIRDSEASHAERSEYLALSWAISILIKKIQDEG